MALLGLTQPPPNLVSSVWEAKIRRNPGLALAEWMAAMEGVRPEVDGPNRGPWLDRILYGRALLTRLGRANDIKPFAYCAAIPLSWMHANGTWLPPPARVGLDWFFANRAALTLMAAFKRAGCYAGPNIPPQPGWLCFWDNRQGSDRGRGGHVDVVTRYDEITRRVGLIGANLSDSFRARSRDLASPGMVGWGVIPPGGRAVRPA